jgi:hypothetical protein
VITAESRSNYCQVIRIVDGNARLVEPEHLTLRPSLAATQHSDNQEFYGDTDFRWSQAAWQRLGSGKRWWIIADYSSIVDPFRDPQTKIVYQAKAQLRAELVGGMTVSSIPVTHPARFAVGDRIVVENLDPATPTRMEAVVQGVNSAHSAVEVIPTRVPAPGIPVALSRVSIRKLEPRRLVCPAPSRAFFECLNFGNPANTLPED